MAKVFDRGQAKTAISVLLEPKTVVELRVMGTAANGTMSGYFDDPDKLLENAAKLSGQAPGVFLTLNPVKRELLSRAENRLKKFVKTTTSDQEIARLRWFYVDVDPVRPSGKCATESEHAAALKRAKTVRKHLCHRGWPEPLFIDSGNGVHLVYRVDLQNNGDGTSLIKRCLEGIAFLFTSRKVKIDVGCNPSRLIRLPGTLNAKGANTGDRPHRLARIKKIPDSLEFVTHTQLEKLAEELPSIQSFQTKPNGAESRAHFDVQKWLQEHHVTVSRSAPWNGGYKWILRDCPWNPEHKNQSAALFQFADGGVGARCLHDSCKGKGWPELRDVFEPGWHQQRSSLEENPWLKIRPMSALIAENPPKKEYLVDRLLVRGCITEIFSPKGLGKTHVAHYYAVQLAKEGYRVLLFDRDNPEHELKRRAIRWGLGEEQNLKYIGRNEAPPLTNVGAWKSFPYQEHDCVIIDSLDSSTEGAGEQDSGKPGKAFAPLLDIAHRDNGPAVFVLGNTVKSGAHARCSGVIGDRADIVYEVRDATDVKFSGKKPWWEELPPGREADFASRATRRRMRNTYRLGLIPSKFRIAAEPDPFCLEIDLSDERWMLSDVTDKLVEAAENAAQQSTLAKKEKLDKAAEALKEKVNRAKSNKPILLADAEEFLRSEHHLTRQQARKLIKENKNRRWRIFKQRKRGAPKVLRPIP